MNGKTLLATVAIVALVGGAAEAKTHHKHHMKGHHASSGELMGAYAPPANPIPYTELNAKMGASGDMAGNGGMSRRGRHHRGMSSTETTATPSTGAMDSSSGGSMGSSSTPPTGSSNGMGDNGMGNGASSMPSTTAPETSTTPPMSSTPNSSSMPNGNTAPNGTAPNTSQTTTPPQ